MRVCVQKYVCVNMCVCIYVCVCANIYLCTYTSRAYCWAGDATTMQSCTCYIWHEVHCITCACIYVCMLVKLRAHDVWPRKKEAMLQTTGIESQVDHTTKCLIQHQGHHAPGEGHAQHVRYKVPRHVDLALACDRLVFVCVQYGKKTWCELWGKSNVGDFDIMCWHTEDTEETRPYSGCALMPISMKWWVTETTAWHQPSVSLQSFCWCL